MGSWTLPVVIPMIVYSNSRKKTIVSIYCPTSPSDKSSLWVQCIRWSPTYSCQRLNSTKTQCASLLSFDWRPTTATKITNWRFCGKAFWKPASNTSNASNAFKCFQYFHWWNSSKPRLQLPILCRCCRWADNLPILCAQGWRRASQTTADPKGAKGWLHFDF